MTIFSKIKEDHDKQRQLVEILSKTHGDSTGRDELFTRLKNELEAHAAAEEQTLYAAMMTSEVTVERARHSIAEHKEIDDFLAELTEMDFSNPNWIRKADDFRHRLEHHLEEEELEIFVSAGKLLSDQKKDDLGEAFSEAKASWLDGRGS